MTSEKSGLSSLATLSVIAAPVCVLADVVFGHHALSILALLLIVFYVAVNFGGTRRTARVFLVLSLAASALYIAQGAGLDDFERMANRSAYLPALIIVLTILRLAAKESHLIRDAGEYAVRQPPHRRFVLLASVSHVFGILLNIGGYYLLLDTAVATRSAAGTSELVRKIQLRRITTAAMRGFAATVIWSPLGLSLNLLLTLIPGVRLLEYLPYGLGVTAAYLVFGLVFDRIQNPVPAPGRRVERGGKVSALFGLVAILVAINIAAASVELILDLPLRAAILIVVPIFAIAWALMAAPKGVGPIAALGTIEMRARRGFPGVVNEICIMGAAGFLGIIVAELIPHEIVDSALALADLSQGPLAAALTLTIVSTSLIGINPLIIATVLVSSVVSTGADIDPILLILAIQIGWSLSLILSPVTSTVIVTSGITGQSSGTIGFRWNGPFCAFGVAFTTVMFLLIGS